MATSAYKLLFYSQNITTIKIIENGIKNTLKTVQSLF